MTDILRFEDVGLRYGLGPEILQDVSFGLQEGSFHFLMGPSGAGKSTLLDVIAGILPPEKGKFSMDGKEFFPYLSRDCYK